MSDLRIIVDGAEGLRVEATGVYADWTLDSVQWLDISGYAAAEDVLDPSLTNGGQVRAVATVTNSEGVSETLETPFVYVLGTAQNVRVDLDSEVTPSGFAFTFGAVEGAATSVEYAPFGESQYDVSVLFTDGRSVNYRLDESDSSVVRHTTEEDWINNFDWSFRASDFDIQGRIMFAYTEFDDGAESLSEYEYELDQLVRETHTNPLGLREETSYENGVITSHQRVDQLDAYAFTSDLRSYEDGLISNRNMQLDNGVGISWSYTEGVLQYRAQFDYEDAFAYDNSVTFYDAEGRTQSGGRTMDDGRQIEYLYADGVLTHAISTDVEDAFVWNEQSSIYENGDFTRRVTVYDDGRVLDATYEPDADGNGSTIQQSVFTDNDDTRSWSEINKYYNEEGVISYAQTVYDNGVELETVYTDGQIRYSNTVDVLDVAAYSAILKTYENGQLDSVATSYDDGVSYLAQYENGIIQDTQTLDNDDAHSYQQKYSIYENGVLEQAVTQMDDGVNYLTHYQDGVIQHTQGLDIQNAVNWQEKYTVYQDGDLVARQTLYDDGRELSISYNPNPDGPGSTINEWVMRDVDDAHSYSEQGKYYQDGVIAFDEIIYDDDATRETTYDDGVRSSRVTTDVNDTRAYETIEQYFDNSGTLRYQNTSLDDGRQVEREYAEDGALEFKVITDVNDAVSYETQTSSYDDGVIVIRETAFDNGVFGTEFFDGTGTRVEDERMDNADAFEWHSINRTYENGEVVSTDIIYDDALIG